MKYTDIIKKVGEILGYELNSEIFYYDENNYCWVIDGIWDGEAYIVFGGDNCWEVQQGLNNYTWNWAQNDIPNFDEVSIYLEKIDVENVDFEN